MLSKKCFVCILLLLASCLELFAQQATREQILKLFYQAQQARQTGKEQEAITLYKRIINLSPRLPDPYQQLGDIYRTDTGSIQAQEKAVALFGFYLQLKPEATDSEVIKSKIDEAKQQLALLEQRALRIEAAPVEEIPVEQKVAEKVVESEAAPEPAIVPKLVTEPELEIARAAFDQNLTGRWVSTTKASNGREAWIMDIKDVDGEYWISINSKSAVKNTSVFEAMTSMDIQGRLENAKLIFNFKVSNVYDASKKETNVMGTVGDFLGNMLGVDVFEWKLFANSKKDNRDLVYEYTFDLVPGPYSMRGHIQTLVKDKAEPNTLITNNTQECELFRAPMNYGGMTIPMLADEEKRQDKEFRELFTSTQKQSATDEVAMNNLGCLYWSGVGTRPNMKKALECFASAALQNTHAQLNLASLYLEGNGVEKDVDKARNWYLSAAEKGFTDAFVLCGDSYIFGDEVDNNYSTALFYYDKAITAGSVFGLFRLGWLYKEGLGVKADRKTALLYLEKAMDAGYTEARVEAAAIYEEEGNLDKALGLLKEAVAENNPQAMLKLSDLYLRGQGVRQDFSQAKSLEKNALEMSVKVLSGHNSLEPIAKKLYNQLAK